MSDDWLIYGANGYTGRMIAREAALRGLKPTLAGRDAAKVEPLAKDLALPSRVFDLKELPTRPEWLEGARLVLNCAGPFSQTAPALIAACLRTKISYLDITGEIDVIEYAAGRDATARAEEIVLMPAVGFDVVPTDCVAATLHGALPDATHLALAFHGTGDVSPGTAKTAVEGSVLGGRARVEGRIVRVPFAWKTRTIPFADGPREAQTIPWGDVASAFYTTGIPNIETYLAMKPSETTRLRWLSRLAPLLRVPGVLNWVQGYVGRTTPGPDERELREGRTEVWGEVRNAAGRTASLTMTTPNAYRLTVLSAVAAVERVLAGGIAAGFQTPARALGADFAASLPGVTASAVRVRDAG